VSLIRVALPTQLRWNITLVTKLNDLFCEYERAFCEKLCASLVTCTGSDISVLTGFGGVGSYLQEKLVCLHVLFFDETVLSSDEYFVDVMRCWMSIASCQNLTSLLMKGFHFRSIPFFRPDPLCTFENMQLPTVFESLSQLIHLCIGNGECDDFAVHVRMKLSPNDLAIVLQFLPNLEVLELYNFGEHLDDNMRDPLLQSVMDIAARHHRIAARHHNILQDFVPKLTAFNNCGHVGSPSLASMFPKLKHVQLAFGESDNTRLSYYAPEHDFMRTFDTINEFIEQKKALLTAQSSGSVEVMVIWLKQTGLLISEKLKDYLTKFSPHKDLNLLSLNKLEWSRNPHNLNPFVVDAAASPRFAWALNISTVGVTVYVIGCNYDELENGPRNFLFT